MTNRFSKSSEQKLQNCHPDLRLLLQLALDFVDFTILETHRNEADQNAAFAAGKSKLKFPHSKHNSQPARAVDIAPVPLNWQRVDRFAYLAGVMMALAKANGIGLRWGGDWNSNGELADNKFDDLPHFELL